MHGEQDADVPFNQGESFAAALAKAGVSVKFAPIAGAGHNLFFPATFNIILNFFDDHLKPKK
jgi:dipeptidyl aminopeptidase/acylaminoacyl peptidase